MIVGDKIVTTHVVEDGALVAVEVIAIEKYEIVWSYGRYVRKVERLHIENARLSQGEAIGRVRKRDRGVTWAPAWIEAEVDLLRVVAGLRTLDTPPLVS